MQGYSSWKKQQWISVPNELPELEVVKKEKALGVVFIEEFKLFGQSLAVYNLMQCSSNRRWGAIT